VTTVASITPIAVGRDSRTLKQALSFERMGMRSVVVEGEQSPTEGRDRSFERIAITASPPSVKAPDGGAQRAGPGATIRRAAEPAAAAYANLRWNQRTARALPDADLYVVHGWSQLPSVWRRAKRAGAPLVYDAHDSYFERYPPGQDPEFASSATRRMFAAMEGRFARGAAAFLTSSEGIADLLERRIGRRPEVIVNYPDTRVDVDPGNDVRSALGLGEREFLLVSVGNAKAGMDVEAGIRAISHLPERAHLALIGGGIEPYEARVRELGLQGRVHLMGPVAPEQVNRFIAGADAGVILYYPITLDFEVAIPNRLFHAVAAGLPVLYPKLPGIASIAEPNDLGLQIDSRDPASIAAAARTLMDDERVLERHRDAARRAAQELSWERQEPKLESLLRAALEDGRPGQRDGA
jgi:glycosyltransferase involved in cell wall biosynthesis